MSAPLLLFDLDGPILDVLPRYHAVHVALVESHGGRPLAADDYWALKRDQIPEAAILSRTGLSVEQVGQVVQERLLAIERAEYVALDRPWPWSRTVLGDVGRSATLMLVTLRADIQLVQDQLGRLGLAPLFESVLAGPGAGPAPKVERVRKAGLPGNRRTVFIGDTEVDIQSGRELGARTVATRTGIRSAAKLATFGADTVIDDIRELPAWLEQEGLFS
jgi:phosphoglycolate phosphatase-like HAD superfamily hydrolase